MKNYIAIFLILLGFFALQAITIRTEVEGDDSESESSSSIISVGDGNSYTASEKSNEDEDIADDEVDFDEDPEMSMTEWHSQLQKQNDIKINYQNYTGGIPPKHPLSREMKEQSNVRNLLRQPPLKFTSNKVSQEQTVLSPKYKNPDMSKMISSSKFASRAGKIQIRVKLYPFIPDYSRFQKILVKAWRKIAPETELQMLSWDGGFSDYPNDTDLFTADLMLLESLKAQNYIQDISKSRLDGIGDYCPSILPAISVGENEVLGVPFLACGEFLIYKKDDKELDSIESLSDLTRVFKNSTYKVSTEASEPTLINLYYESLYEVAKASYPPSSELDPDIMKLTKDLLEISRVDSLEPDEGSVSGVTKLLVNNKVRAITGFSELLSGLPQPVLERLAWKVFPYNVEKGKAPAKAYLDVTCITPEAATRGVLDYAIRLANVLSSDLIISKYMQRKKEHSYNFVMPIRKSTLSRLPSQAPLLLDIVSLMSKREMKFSRLPKGSRNWGLERGKEVCSRMQDVEICKKLVHK